MEGEGVYVGVDAVGVQRTEGFEVEQLHGAVLAAGEEVVAVGGDGEGADFPAVGFYGV